MKKSNKFVQSIKELEHALSFAKRIKEDRIYFNGISKSFETCVEYAWKFLKSEVNQQGIEAYSPKESTKEAGRLGLIDDVEQWLRFLEARNQAVHDYLGLDDKTYLDLIKMFLTEVKKL